MTLPKPTAILFDWDNTLVDTWPMIHAALNMTLRYMEHPEWTLEKVKSNVTRSMRDSFPEMFKERWEEAAQHYQDSYRATHLERLQALPGAEAMLIRAKERAPLAVVSNKKGQSLRKELTHLGWDKYFAAAVGAGDAAKDKPNPEHAMAALDTLKTPNTRSVWFVGDTVVDIECAKNIGATAILYGDHVTDGNLFEGFPFAAQVRTLDELTALIDAAR